MAITFLTIVQDSSFKAVPTIFIYELDRATLEGKTKWKPVRELFDEKEAKDTKDGGDAGRICDALWGPLNTHIIAGYADGSVRKWDVESGKQTEVKVAHKKQINSVQFSRDQTMFITASSDQTAKLWDTKSMDCLKTYQSDRPLNAAAISPIMNHVIVGGGQEAMNVTRTTHKSGHFEIDFHHLVLQDFLGSVKGHFGPINTLAFTPDGKSFASGSEDGYVRLHFFPQPYFDPKDKFF